MRTNLETAVYISEQIKLKEESDRQHKINKYYARESQKDIKKEIFDWHPHRCEDFEIPLFTIPASKFIKARNEKLSKVLAFIDCVKNIRFKDGCTIMPIATTNKRMISICGTPMGVSRLISFMKELGLISDEDTTYAYNRYYESDNKSKTYRYYYDNEIKVKEFCEENNINIFEVKNYIGELSIKSKNLVNITNFDNKQVAFNSHVHFLRPSNYSITEFEEYLTLCLYNKYPQLEVYQKKADMLNEKFYRDYTEFAISFRPNFVWNTGNKSVRKIGIRATNSLVGAANKELDALLPSFKGKLKNDILLKYGFNLVKDVKSSIPRITLSINTGKWISESIDMYEKIYYEYINSSWEEYTSSTVANNLFSAQLRDAFKDLHMRAYFDDYANIGNHTRRYMKSVDDKIGIDLTMQCIKRAVQKAEGGILYDSEIFFHESCIYIDVLEALLNEGYFVWQCYDCWHAKKEGITQDYFYEHVTALVEEKANEYISKYFGVNEV